MKGVIKPISWVAGSLVAIFVILAGGFWWFLDSTADQMCGNQIIYRIDLKERQMSIVVFQRDCGATTGFSTQISMMKRDEKLPNKSGNLFIADTNHRKAPSSEGGDPEVKVNIISNNHIEILHHENARVFKNEVQWEGVKISYGNL